MDPIDNSLVIASIHWEQMRDDVARRAPEEACGIVAGRGGQSRRVFEITNAERSPTRYRMAPEEQLQAMLAIEDRGWDLQAIYHSHPNGPEIPSPTDVAEAAYPEAIHLIWSVNHGKWQCRAFTILEKQVQEVFYSVQA